MPKACSAVFLLAVFLIVNSGCGGIGSQVASNTVTSPTASPSPTPTPVPTPTASPTPTPTPSPNPSPNPSPTPLPTPSPTPSLPVVDHVFVVVLENHGFAQVIGNSSMPYLNSLATRNSLATNYFANTHPSIGNYFMMTVGQVESTNDAFAGVVTDDNIVRALLTAGKTWKAYVQSLPSIGYLGNDVYPYLKHHDPFAYFNDVVNSSTEASKIVPFDVLQTDLAAGVLPAFAFLLPNAENDAHDCPTGGSACPDADKLASADVWLRSNLDPLITTPSLLNSVFIVVFDEALDADTTHGGGKVAFVIAGTHVKTAYQSVALYQHQSTLRLILDLLRTSDHPGLSATAPPMLEFFQ
jgi:phosphatidylinositol-3-phosphatase